MSLRQDKPASSPKGAAGTSLVQQASTKGLTHVVVALAYDHQAGNSLTIINADFSILEVVDSAIMHLCQSIGTDIAFLASADKEDFACVGVLDELQLCVL